MINSVRLVNFQCHKDRVIKFDPGINAITGESRIGKSAIFRSLLFVFNNESKDTDVVNWDAKFAEVTGSINDVDIIRTKGGSKNTYKIGDSPAQLAGVGVPDEVMAVTHIDEINIERQHDDYFLIRLTPGNLGRYFNELVGLENIDQTFETINRIQSENNSSLKLKEEKLSEADEERKKLNFIDDCEVMFMELNYISKQQNERYKRHKKLTDKINELNILDTVDYDPIITAAQKIIDMFEGQKQNKVIKRKLIDLAEEYSNKIIDLSGYDKIEKQVEKIKQLKLLKNNILSAVNDYPGKDTTEAEIVAVQEELREIAPECPTCGRSCKCL